MEEAPATLAKLIPANRDSYSDFLVGCWEMEVYDTLYHVLFRIL